MIQIKKEHHCTALLARAGLGQQGLHLPHPETRHCLNLWDPNNLCLQGRSQLQAMAHRDHSAIIFGYLECLFLVQLSPEGFLVLAVPLPLNP